MINNRQAGRRNRGRNNNNGRPSGGNRGGGDSGNRIDNRARGNAVQLLEKYKNMARDAQMAGDRVNAEYYLQFADHYFRVLADNRARQEEQQQRYRRPEDNGDYEGDDFDAPEYAGDDNRGEPQQQHFERGYEGDRRRDQPRDQQDNRDRNRRDRPRRDRPAYEAAERQEMEAPEAPAPVVERSPAPQPEAEAAAAPEAPRARRGRPRKADTAKSEGSEGLDLSVLPPSIARADNDSEPAAEEAPRKRTRRARPAAEAAE